MESTPYSLSSATYFDARSGARANSIIRILGALLIAATVWCTSTVHAAGANAEESDDEANAAQPDAKAKVSKGEELFWEALTAFNDPKTEAAELARAKLEQAATLEFTHAQTTLANCLLSGSQGFKKDVKRAFLLFRLAAERGNAYAMVSLGQCYAGGVGTRKNPEQAVRWLEAALDSKADYTRPTPVAGVAEKLQAANSTTLAGTVSRDPAVDSRTTAHLLLAGLLSDQGNSQRSHTHFVAAAEAEGTKQGYSFAAIQAAVGFAFGKGAAQDLDAANRMIELSSTLVRRSGALSVHNYVALKMVDEFAAADLEEEVNNAAAKITSGLQKDIATTFANRKSKDYNPAQARKWYTLAADNGDHWAAMELALMLARGELGSPDWPEVRRLFESVYRRHRLASGNYAICLYHGLGGPVDREKAAEVFKEYKNSSLICHLGTLGKPPEKPMTYEEVMEMEAALATNDHHVAFLQGDRYENGHGVDVDRMKAAKFYDRAIKGGHGYACLRLALLIEKNGAVAEKYDAYNPITLFDLARERGVGEAYFYLAHRYESGTRIKRDVNRAYELYLEALKFNPSDGGALNNIGLIDSERAVIALKAGDKKSAEENLRRYLAHLESSLEAKSALAGENLGKVYSEEFDSALRPLLPPDEEKAFNYFLRAADLESTAKRHVLIAKRFEFGVGTQLNVMEATYHYRLAALDGDLLALRKMSAFYMQGKGGEVDLDRAIFWLDALARKGDMLAFRNYADVLLRLGKYSEARKLLQQLTENLLPYIQGFANARLYLIYSKGLGVKPNARKAEKFKKLALDLGFGQDKVAEAMGMYKKAQFDDCLRYLEDCADLVPEGRYKLGVLLYGDKNVKTDQELGARYLRQAADENQLDACYQLAALTAKNLPHAPSLEEALRYARKAEAGSIAGADKLVRILSKRQSDTHAK